MAPQLRQRDAARGARVSSARVSTVRRTVAQPLEVLAFRKVKKQQQVVLLKDVPNLGQQGTLTKVSNGYFRNYLLPQRMASLATPSVLADFEAKEKAKEDAKAADLATAKALATALTTLGKFTIKKTVGEEGKIFGSVSASDVADAIKQQTSKDLDKSMFTVPDISTVGTYDIVAKPHPDVACSFKLIVDKA